MARRRLSDLLREEANKPSDEATAAAGAEQSADEPDAETLDAEIVDAEPLEIAPSGSTTASTTAKNAATKRTEATEPPAPIAPKQDDALLQKIAELTSDLEAQKATVATLQTELKHMNALKTELEQTRKEARQLAASNDKLTQELKSLQPQKTKAATSAPTTKTAPRPPQELQLAPSPVEASGHPLNTFNRDVGWFD